MKWLQVELNVSGELAEPVADLLTRYAPNGVSLSQAPSSNESPDGSVTVHAYLPIDRELQSRRRSIEEGLWHLRQIQPLPPARYTFIEDQDWSEIWKQRWRQLEIGTRFLVLPAWLPERETDRLVIRMDPGMAFGTGTHPSTQLCLLELENRVQRGDSLVDLGCGSGILSIAGVLLGAEQVLALDIDSQAVEAAKSNAARNGVVEKIRVQHGSLQDLSAAVLDGPAPDLILANILAPVLEDMLDQGLPDLIGAETTLILSGVIEEQVGGLLKRAERHGLTAIEDRSEKDWHALTLRRNPLPG